MDSTNDSSPSLEEALNIVNHLVSLKRGKSLSKPEIALIRGAWNEQNYKQMADDSNYTVNYLQRNLAPKLFDDLTRIFGSEVNKNNLKTIFKILLDEHVNNNYSFLNKVRGSLPPDISKFYGRTTEISHLKNLMCSNRCISIVGVTGIGKSALAAKLMADVISEKKPHFDCLIWKSVSHRPLLQDLVTDLLTLIDPVYNCSHLPDNTHSRISILIKLLQKKPCFVVLDDFSVPFQNHETDFIDYRWFLRRLVEEQHQSCFIFTSRQLQDITKELIQAKRPIDCFKLEGLKPAAAMELLSAQGLKDREKCYELIQKYRGNPSELEAVVHRIRNVFGSEEIFFQNPTTLVSNKFESMLDEMFSSQLTKFQKQILAHIAKVTDELDCAIKLTKLLVGLKENIELVSTSEVVKAIEKLEQCSLIEKKQSPGEEISFAIQPVIKKYIKTNYLNLVHR